MKRSLVAGCAIAAASSLVAVGGLAFAEEGRALTVSDSPVTVGRAFTVSGDGCVNPDAQWVHLRVGSEDRVVAAPAEGVWSAQFQVPTAATGLLQVSAVCGDGDAAWNYGTTAVTVEPMGEFGTEIEPQLWLSHPTVTAGRVINVSGDGCTGAVEVKVGDQARSVDGVLGSWRLAFEIPLGTTGELPVTATCQAVQPFTYPASSVMVVAEGDLGLPPMPDTGDGEPAATPTPTPTPTAAPTATAPARPEKPGLPKSGW